MAGCKSCSFRFLQIVRASIYHCQSPSLSLPPSISSCLSVLWASPLYLFTQMLIFHSSISNVSSFCLWSSLQISIALYRWLVICPRVIMNPGQGPDRWLLSPSISPSLQKWPNISNSSQFPDIWCFLANISHLFCPENPCPKPWVSFMQRKMNFDF